MMIRNVCAAIAIAIAAASCTPAGPEQAADTACSSIPDDSAYEACWVRAVEQRTHRTLSSTDYYVGEDKVYRLRAG